MLNFIILLKKKQRDYLNYCLETLSKIKNTHIREYNIAVLLNKEVANQEYFINQHLNNIFSSEKIKNSDLDLLGASIDKLYNLIEIIQEKNVIKL